MKVNNNYFKSLLGITLLAGGISSCNMMEDNIEGADIQKATGLSTSPNILYQENFEGSDPLSFTHQQLSEDHSFRVANNPVFQGAYSGRFELNDDDDMVSNGTRAEVLFPEQSENERWYSYSLYLPANGFEKDSNNDIITQWHQGSGSGSPTTTFRIKEDRFFLKSGPTKEERKDYDVAAVKKDAWNEFVFHIIHSSGSDGLVEVWMNGEKVLDIKGGNIDKNYGLPRWKIGIYKDDWNGSETTDADQRIMYFDNVRMGDENASFEEMSSLGGEVGVVEPTPDPEEGNELPSEGPVHSLTLINTSSDEAVGDFLDQATIGAKDHRLSIVPNFEAGSEPVEVKFDLSGAASKNSLDDTAPFSLSGDDGNGNFWYGDGLYPGDYELLVTPYYNVNGEKVAGPAEKFRFTIITADENAILENTSVAPELPSFDIQSLSLINTSSDKEIGQFNSGSIITAKDHRLSIVPNYEGTAPVEVLLDLSGAANRSNLSESAPFSLNGDDGNGNFWYGEGLYPGDYELEITPFFEVDGEKITGNTEVFRFTIEEGNSTTIG
ncbi:polysaccharide lyase [Echinicola marina]|uniref:polysaccharide lyase n=1 Tax=Echinicola marina TaxID=2859768 RepID=UPI001CF6274F|nr:polysaccharide lyase [Echinicola marina]UCS92973.1 polysaccharide lyase [Echinicola marina]